MEEKRLRELVVQFKNGDLHFFDEFYNSVKTPVFYNILALTRDYDVAEDLLQDTFVKFLKIINKVDANDSILGFLMTMSRNLTLDYFKKANKTRELDEVTDEPQMASSDNYGVDEEILIERIKKILKEKEFMIFTLHVLSELTFDEISKQLHKPLGTVLWTYNNAIKKLQKELVYEKD